MKTTKVEQNFKEYLESIKVYGKPILSPMEIDYLAGGTDTAAYEFKQEKGESDEEFFKNFEAWLHEDEVTTGYADYFLFLGLRRHEKLTPWAFKSLEKAVTECFEKGQGWLYEVNHRYSSASQSAWSSASKRHYRDSSAGAHPKRKPTTADKNAKSATS